MPVLRAAPAGGAAHAATHGEDEHDEDGHEHEDAAHGHSHHRAGAPDADVPVPTGAPTLPAPTRPRSHCPRATPHYEQAPPRDLRPARAGFDTDGQQVVG